MRSLSLQDLWRRRFHRRLAASPWSTREITSCDDAREEHYSRSKGKIIIKAILIYAVAPYLPRASYFFCTCAFSGNLPLWTNSFASQRVKRRSWRFVYTDRGDGAYVGMKLHLRRIILFMFVCFFFFLLQSMLLMLCKCTRTFNLQHTCVAVCVRNVFLQPQSLLSWSCSVRAKWSI